MDSDWDHYAVIGWLMREGRMLASRDAIIEGLGQRMLAAGAPVHRIRLTMRMLHPLLAAVSATWEAETGLGPMTKSRRGFEMDPSVAGSPFRTIALSQKPFRRRLDGLLGPEDHEVLHELSASGITDYFGLPLFYSNGSQAIFVLNSRQSGGFSDRDLEKFGMIAASLSPVVEVIDARQVAETVAEAYLGPRTGRRVLDGKISRGDIERIDAAILISDMRGWTRLNNEASPEEAVAIANRYFETLGAAVDSQDGEILKFLGDGVLAIFPAEGGDACRRALAAAQQTKSGDLPVSFGIGLHYGPVLYGNVGSETRIDFTVLGQAVNIAARIEGLCAGMGETILYSEDFAVLAAAASRPMGEHALKGLEQAQPIFAPA